MNILFRIFFFFFNDTATTEIYTLSLHDALPIFVNLLSKKLFNAEKTLKLNFALKKKKWQTPRVLYLPHLLPLQRKDRKSTRLNSSHANISYAVFCLKKKTKKSHYNRQSILLPSN